MKKGFTLAEVLITLGIIGVIAALTIPGIIGDTSDRQNMTKFKKAHAVLSQALATQVATTGTNARTTTDALSQFFGASMNASAVTATRVTTVDGMSYTFAGSACDRARTAGGLNVGGTSNCTVTVDINGVGNGLDAASTGRITNGTQMIRDTFTLQIFDEVVAPENGTLEADVILGAEEQASS